MNKAWHLRQDGKAFPVTVHMYCMQDEDLSSEAEVASFLISSDSMDQDLAENVLDRWMAFLIQDDITHDVDESAIEELISANLSKLPYRFPYPLSTEDYLDIHRRENNYYDIDSYYEFLDDTEDNLKSIQSAIAHSFNQQFCRVRYGGKYDSVAGNSGLWFRISSVGFDWYDIIWQFVEEFPYKVDNVTVCRDAESDELIQPNTSEYFYRSKDGTLYYNMPKEEFIVEEHEKSPVFASSFTDLDLGEGVMRTIRKILAQGGTIFGACNYMAESNIELTDYDVHKYMKKFWEDELNADYVESSEWLENLPTRSASKIYKVKHTILKEYPELTDIDIDYKPRPNRSGKMVGFELIVSLQSDNDKLDGIEIGVVSTKSLSDVPAESIVRLFKNEYNDYIKFKNI